MDQIDQNALEPAAEEGLYEVNELASPELDPIVGLLGRFRYAIVALLAVLALVSLFPLRETFSSPETYTATISTLDEKKANVTALVASSTALSAGISVLPDDTGSAIADKLMDVSVDLGIVLVVIYLEKYLLTIFGFLSFGVLMPIGLAGLAAAVALLGRSAISRTFTHVAVRLLLLGAILVSVVPASVWVTDRIDETYETSVAVASTEQEAEAQEQPQSDEGDGGILEFITGIPEAVANLPQTVADGVTSVTQDILDQVNALVEAFAVMVVTSCAVPVLVLLLFLWVANMLLGIKIEVPVAALQQRARDARRGARGAVGSVRKGIKKQA
ncbi:hypothetical protein [Thermophilibacter mediterraneus]|uniref:hypothetical protein n=1 Tax=Thermophilibacter mediterraneus TaxID=1871031 RepID=UPI000930FD1E|nr:hypothetical protein [Thermophilibacter mediterraneus]